LNCLISYINKGTPISFIWLLGSAEPSVDSRMPWADKLIGNSADIHLT